MPLLFGWPEWKRPVEVGHHAARVFRCASCCCHSFHSLGRRCWLLVLSIHILVWVEGSLDPRNKRLWRVRLRHIHCRKELSFEHFIVLDQETLKEGVTTKRLPPIPSCSPHFLFAPDRLRIWRANNAFLTIDPHPVLLRAYRVNFFLDGVEQLHLCFRRIVSFLKLSLKPNGFVSKFDNCTRLCGAGIIETPSARLKESEGVFDDDSETHDG